VIRAGAPTSDGGQLVLLGITPARLRDLKDGQPIYVECDDLGLPRVRIVLVFGQTERAIIAEMRAAGAELPDSVDQGLRDVEREQRDKGTQP
jgi:hypothetical protein